ncbi:MAG: DUF2971 domain-containing protein [Burkholderiales bacterium]|nr:DUF2971 domain-containing protein [Burkholderiales bacterium]
MLPKRKSLTVPEAHPELLHYTSISGLLGILESQSLRATNSAFLNDSMEINLFFETRLANILESGIRAELAADPSLRVLPQFARTPEEANSAIARYATDMTAIIRTTTHRFNNPHFTCFSTPTNDRVRRDGLLSQWRGYGKDGGYCLVFDSSRLEEILKTEATSFWYQHVQWGDVHYHQDDDDLDNAEPEIQEAEDALRDSIGRYIKNSIVEELESTFEPVSTLSCLFKHWGFHEEREVRIVVIPPNAELVQEGRANGEVRATREPKSFVRGGTPVPYIDLFALEPNNDVGFRLPILRVIIGPHAQSSLRKTSVEELLRARGIAAEVAISRIPYVGG